LIAGFLGATEMVTLLLDHGEDKHAALIDGWTPLHAASARYYHQTVSVLVSREADVSTTGCFGLTSVN
jgi:hypothetical protein